MIFALAVVLRVGLFPFAENKHGDAPMRALIAERMVLDPASAADPAHLLPVRPAAHDADAPVHRARQLRAALVALSVAALRAGGLLPVSRLRAPAGRRGAGAAGGASRWRSRRCICRRRPPPPARRSIFFSGSPRSSASWPRSIAASSATFAVAGLLASLAAVTRYDAWLALPMVAVAAWWFAREPDPASATRGLAGLRAGGVAFRSPGSPGGRRPAAIRSSSRTTSPVTTPASGRRRRRATAPGWGGRASSASGRWRFSRR